MADFTPVALGVKPPQGMSLSEMVNFANAAQQLQQARQINPLQVERATEEVKQAKIKSESDEMGLSQKKFKSISDSQIAMINNPLVIAAEQNPSAVNKQALADLVMKNGLSTAKALNIPQEQAMQLLAPYLEIAEKSPSELRQFYKQRHIQGLDDASRTSALAASGTPINTGASGYTVQTGEFGPSPAGTIIKGTGYTQQLPPTQQLVSQAGDNTGLPPGTPYILGPQGAQAVGQPKLATGISPSGLAATTVTNADWAKTQEDATKAQQRIGIFQNIKKFAPDAFTGVGGQRKELAAGVLNAIGISAYEAEKISTEELAKNSALLAMAGGNTDAARALAEIATPNKKLNEKAIKGIADQLIGVEKMNQAKAEYLSPVAGDQAKYQERLQMFNRIADPRLFQEASPEDVAKMKARMSKAEIEDFSRRVLLLKQMGLAR